MKRVHTQHVYGDWTPDAENEENHIRTCTVCGETEAEAHQFAWVIDAEATVTAPGAKHEECAVCGKTRNENTEIPQLDDDTPTDPTDPSDPGASSEKEICHLCGKIHEGSYIETLKAFLHNMIVLILSLFKMPANLI